MIWSKFLAIKNWVPLGRLITHGSDSFLAPSMDLVQHGFFGENQVSKTSV